MNAKFSLQSVLAILLFLGAAVSAPTLKADTTRAEPTAQGLVRHLDKLHDKLRLRPDQQTLWDLARQKSIEVQAEVRSGKRAMVELSETELERATPDLLMISRKFDELEQRNMALEHQVRPLWLKVYETLSTEQIGVVRDALKSELRRYKLFQNLRERFL